MRLVHSLPSGGVLFHLKSVTLGKISTFHVVLPRRNPLLACWNWKCLSSVPKERQPLPTLAPLPTIARQQRHPGTQQRSCSTAVERELYQYRPQGFRKAQGTVGVRKRSRREGQGSVPDSLARMFHTTAARSKGQTLGSSESGRQLQAMDVARDIFSHAVSSVLPHQMIEKNLHYDVASSVLRVASREYRLQRNVHVVGFGKAVLGMARALEDAVGDHVVGGVLSVPQGSQVALQTAGLQDMLLQPTSKIRVLEGAANNLPDQAAQEAAQEIGRMVEAVGADDILVVLISGGGSALLPAPAPPLTLTDTLEVTRLLSRSGVNILDLNMVRKQLDRLKGGGIARLAQPAKVLSLILSDIIGDDLSSIASGPTVPDRSTPQQCLDLFSRCGLTGTAPASVLAYLRSKAAESAAPARQEDFSHVQNVLIGTNKIACEAACERSSALGFDPCVLSTELSGEARPVGVMFAVLAKFITEVLRDETSHTRYRNGSQDSPNDENNRDISSRSRSLRDRLVSEFGLSEGTLSDIARQVREAQLSASSRGVCIVAGGETTVAVKGRGKGGRNQEMAVAAGVELHALFSGGGHFASGRPAHHSSDGSTHPGPAHPPVAPETGPASREESPSGVSAQGVAFLSAGTDGQDGPTTAAGGVVGADFLTQATDAGLDVLKYLDDNDTFSLLTELGGGSHLVVTGLTGTNVMDLQILLVEVRQS